MNTSGSNVVNKRLNIEIESTNSFVGLLALQHLVQCTTHLAHADTLPYEKMPCTQCQHLLWKICEPDSCPRHVRISNKKITSSDEPCV